MKVVFHEVIVNWRCDREVGISAQKYTDSQTNTLFNELERLVGPTLFCINT